MLTAHSNVLRIYVARFPASSPANFFIPFAPHPATRRPPFLRSSNGRKSSEAVSFRGRRPWKNPPFRRAFCKKANFSTARSTRPENHVPPRPLINLLLPPRPKFRLSLVGWIPDQPVHVVPYSWIPSYWLPCYSRDGQCQCVFDSRVSIRARVLRDPSTCVAPPRCT